MGTFYENTDLIKLADKFVNVIYKNKDIRNYVHNGKKLPLKYENLIQRSIQCSHIENNMSLHNILINAIRYSFNQTTLLNTTVARELRMYRESCERNKIILMSLKKKKNTGDFSEEIENKEREIDLLEKKINEISTLSSSKPEYNKNILSLAEEVYLLFLRIDKTPYYFYAEICKKLGYRVNLDQLFPGFREKDSTKKKDEDDEDYKNFIEMNVKKTTYVPPAFRKNNEEEKINKLQNIINKEENNISIENMNKIPTVNDFPELISTSSMSTNKEKLGMWGKKLTILNENKIEENKIEENKIEINNLDMYILPKLDEYEFSTSWE
jgi:hypothetical protein